MWGCGLEGWRAQEWWGVRVERLGTWGCANGCGDMDMGLEGTRGHREGGRSEESGDMETRRHEGGDVGDMGTQMGGEVRTVGDMGTQRHEGGDVGDVGRGLVGTLGHGDTEMGGEVRTVGT